MIGISAVSGLDLRRCATSKPLKSGIITSSSTKSGCSLSTCSKACRPLLAVAIANFSFVRSTFNNNTIGHHIVYDEDFVLRRIYFHVHLCIIFFPVIKIVFIQERYLLKYSIMRHSPSSNSIVGCHFSLLFANVISG